MYPFVQKARKVLVVLLMAIGAIAVLWFLYALIAGGFNAMQRGALYSSRGLVNSAPSAGGVFEAPGLSGISDFFTGRDESSRDVSVDSVDNGGQADNLAERKVIKNGDFSLLVNKAEDAADAVKNVAAQFGGFVQDARVYEVADGIKAGIVTIRVPADKFDAALQEVKKLAVKVESEQVSSDDVTDEFVDFEARLKSLRAQEAQYLEILRQSDTVQDTLSVAQYLNSVRGQIEHIQGQLQYLSRQVDMSTITASLTSEADIEIFGIRWRPLFIIKQSIRNLLTGITGYVNAMIAFLFRLPVIALWIATVLGILWVLWKLALWLRGRFFPPHGAF